MSHLMSNSNTRDMLRDDLAFIGSWSPQVPSYPADFLDTIPKQARPATSFCCFQSTCGSALPQHAYPRRTCQASAHHALAPARLDAATFNSRTGWPEPGSSMGVWLAQHRNEEPFQALAGPMRGAVQDLPHVVDRGCKSDPGMLSGASKPSSTRCRSFDHRYGSTVHGKHEGKEGIRLR